MSGLCQVSGRGGRHGGLGHWLGVVGFVLVALAAVSLVRERLVPYGADLARASWRLTGDEPSYLVTAQALASGDGENARGVLQREAWRNFQNKRPIGPKTWTWQYFQDAEVRPLLDRSRMWGDVTRGRQTCHRPPLEAVLAAPFALKETNVRWSVLCAQGTLAVLLVALSFLLVVPHGTSSASRATMLLVAFLVLCGLPALYYTAEIFPEVPCGCLLLFSLAALGRSEKGWRRVGCLVLMLMPWATARVVPAVACVAVLCLVRAWREKDWVQVGIVVAMGVTYLAYNLWLWGDVLPPNPAVNSHMSMAWMPEGLVTFFWNRAMGLFLLNPAQWVVFLLALAALGMRRTRNASLMPWVMFVCQVLTVAAFPDYRAGTCPAGRYQVIAGFLLLPAAWNLLAEGAEWPRFFRTACWLLGLYGALSLVVAGAVAWLPSSWFQRYHPLFYYQAIQPYYDWLPFWKPTGNLRAWWPWLVFFGVPVVALGAAAWRDRKARKG